MSQLFSEDTVFISKQKEKEEVFKEIAGKLLERKLVTS
ncbi:PTS sugar transporter subunit IIA, partial [Streptococcus mutans]|nr:PTS sugar transporter subunit IIA [Streptococcus mutans]